ncbi:hypothetical protein HDE_05773 [Halotydeus destructor]|nr:hypothetical protein HDE_05773 [Halotydeus destructor]
MEMKNSLFVLLIAWSVSLIDCGPASGAKFGLIANSSKVINDTMSSVLQGRSTSRPMQLNQSAYNKWPDNSVSMMVIAFCALTPPVFVFLGMAIRKSFKTLRGFLGRSDTVSDTTSTRANCDTAQPKPPSYDEVMDLSSLPPSYQTAIKHAIATTASADRASLHSSATV